MQRLVVLMTIFCLCAFTTKSDVRKINNNGDPKKFPTLLVSSASNSAAANNLVDSIFNSLDLEQAGLSREAFFEAYKGYEYLLSKNKLRRKDLLTIADFSQSSSKKRLYIIDLAKGKILFNTYVAHGHNSGTDYATSFSNAANSNKSSLGFLVTAETYNGGKGYSLRFDGVEKGINDNVRDRAIVMHGSSYVNPARAANGTMMGRSWGCPAVSYAEHKTIINTIKGGSCFFIYSPDAFYVNNSKILNTDFSWPDLQQQQNPPIIEAPVVITAR